MHALSQRMALGWRRSIWIALLVAASIAFTLGFACATPFAAFAAAAALTMTRRNALFLVGLVWLANQGVGFGVLHYPWTADCLAWGFGLGVVALLSTLAAEFGAKHFIAADRTVASTAAFLSAFALHEGLLFMASIIFQSGVEAYAPAIVGRIFAINAVAFLGLLVVSRSHRIQPVLGEERFGSGCPRVEKDLSAAGQDRAGSFA
ncbi:hypothetical protein RZS28_11640 [Methylocapsa polymorpha]|uniref:Uncharacterized protein n=1 Tax=Methylocapsa polymorpha TaxID=3080828 RepID=A0ABZ0HME9_9HYPH|nr:hypothetical protein RZS28_11640 [Methylocapsa sp. RX1]